MTRLHSFFPLAVKHARTLRYEDANEIESEMIEREGGEGDDNELIRSFIRRVPFKGQSFAHVS